MAKVDQLREDYQRGSLDRADLQDDPVAQFAQWIEYAIEDALPEPNAMTLATVDERGYPNARVVLLKGFDRGGFVFYTNYESEKGRELATKPAATLVFNWLQHERQVRIRGEVVKTSREETDEYFHSRPQGSQIGAWASPQSRPIASRDILESRLRELQEKYGDEARVPVPEHWGGYRVIPFEIEFWQGRSNRLHDRFRYTMQAGAWKVERLAP